MAIAENTAQRNTTSSNGGATVTFTFPSAPAAGNLVVLGFSWRGDTTVSAVPHSCSLATNGGDGSGIDSAIYYKIASGSEGVTWTFDLVAAVKSSGVATTFTGVLQTSPLDKTNLNTATGTAGTTGTTGVLAQADEVVICLFSNINSSTWGTYDNSQTEVGQIASGGGAGTTRNNTALTQRIVTATTAVNYGATLSASQVWSSAVATFKAAVPIVASTVKVWSGSAWGLKPIKRWTGSEWLEAVVKRWTGSAWVDITPAGVTYLLSDNFEYVDAAAAATGGWTNTGSPGWGYATSPAPLQGSYSLNLPTASDYTEKGFTSSAEIHGYVQVNFSSVASIPYVLAIKDSGSENVILIRFTDENEVRVAHGTAQADTTGSLGGTGTRHVWWQYVKGTGSNGEARIWVSTTATKPGSASATITTGTSTNNAVKVQMYSGVTATCITDKLRIAATSIGSDPT